jgi:4-amino-4-deoxychorismate lyase
MKHLNRLEQVLAQMEWNDPAIAEGLMLDTEGELVCGTSSNVFVVRDGVVTTPDLRFCGVAGVMRAKVLEAAAQLGIPSSEEPLWPHDVETASEVFVTNAVRGVRSVRALEALHWDGASVAQRLRGALQL